MKKILLPLLAVALIGAAGCSSLQIRTQQADGVDLRQYKTFNFDQTPDPNRDRVDFSEINQKYVRDAITKELRARGYSKSKHPDLLISLYLKVEDKQEVVRTPVDYGRPGYYYGGSGYYGYYSGYRHDWNHAYTVNYTLGTLIIDFVDIQKEQMVWQGVAQDLLPNPPAKNPKPIIENIIKKVFKSYPAAGGGAKMP